MSFTAKDQEEIIDSIILNVVENTTEITDVNVGGVLRQFIESVGIEIKDLYDQLDTIYQGTRIDTATGTDLEQLGKLLGLTRKSGTTAIGDVTFKRNTPIGADFTIAQGLIVATQPNTGSIQLRFLTSSPTTFYSSITDESHEFIEGLDEYQFNERFVANTSSVIITGTTGGNATSYINITDFNVIDSFNDFIETPSSIVSIDTCETANFTESDDAQACTTSTDKKQGTYSLNIGKNGSVTTNATYSKTLGAVVDGSTKDLVLWLYLADTTTINKLNYIYIWLGNSGGISNSYQYKISRSDLETGWKRYKLSISDSSTVTAGYPSLASINYLRLRLITNNTSDLITLGDIKMDWWHFAETDDYEGNIIRWTDTTNKPDTTTNFLIDYTPLSREVSVYSEAVGADYNVAKNKIVYQISSISGINSINNYAALSGGSDEEEDADLKERILYATELLGKATAESIRQAILGVDGITSCSIDDMPLRSITSEVHTYTSGVNVYALDREVLYLENDKSNLSIYGTVSATSYTFLYGTDYVALYDTTGADSSNIQFETLGTKPDSGSMFYADYDYKWLGHVTAFVAGNESPLPSSILTNVSSAVSTSKAAGIVVTITEPTTITVDVTATILADTANGYTFIMIEQNIIDAITNYINTLGTGEDVYVAKLYDVIMDVTGVSNSNITDPAADVTIAVSEVAKVGTITLSSM